MYPFIIILNPPILSYNKKIWFLVIIFNILFFQKNNAKNNYENQKNKNQQVEFTLLYNQIDTNNFDKKILGADFKTMPKSNSFGFNTGKYWLKLIVNKTVSNKNLVAYIPTHNIGKIDIYQNINNQLKYISSTGNDVAVDKLPVNYKFPVFKINTSNTDELILYLKVNFPKEANFPLKIIPEKSFISYVSNKQIVNSIYYGSCVIVIFFNFLFFLKFKDKSYLFYLLFISSLMFIFLLYDGSLITLFRGNSFYYKIEVFTHISAAVWFLLFSVNFLNLKKRHPIFTKTLYLFPIVITILYTFYFASNKYIIFAIADAFGIMLLPILWSFGIYYIRKKPYAKFYVFGYVLLIPLAVYFMIGFPFGFWEVNGEMLIIKISSWLDMFVFTYALSLKMKNNIDKNDKKIIELQNQLQTYETNSSSKSIPKLIDSYFNLLKENKLITQPLTLRELDILKSICEGLNNTEISKQLFISKNTVKYHIRNIYTKADVNSRTELKEKLFNNNNNIKIIENQLVNT